MIVKDAKSWPSPSLPEPWQAQWELHWPERGTLGRMACLDLFYWLGSRPVWVASFVRRSREQCAQAMEEFFASLEGGNRIF